MPKAKFVLDMNALVVIVANLLVWAVIGAGMWYRIGALEHLLNNGIVAKIEEIHKDVETNCRVIAVLDVRVDKLERGGK